MSELPTYDDAALDHFADLICGNSDGFISRPWYKRGNELPSYFRRAGLSCEDYDYDVAPSRKVWVRERLKEYQRDPNQFVKAITHVAHPAEHRSQADNAREALRQLNDILAADGLKAVYDGAGFRLEGEDFVFSPESQPTSPTIEPLKVTGLIPEEQLAQIVQSRFDEAAKSRSAGAHLSAVIMLGSGLEGLPVGFTRSQIPTAMRSQKAPKDQQGQTKHIGEWKLSELIDVAHDVKWIQKDTHAFGHNVRDFRNLVHPYKQYRQNFEPTDEGTCRLCWEVVSVVFDDLHKQVEREQPTVAASS